MSWYSRLPDLLLGRALEYHRQYIPGVEQYVKQNKALNEIEEFPWCAHRYEYSQKLQKERNPCQSCDWSIYDCFNFVKLFSLVHSVSSIGQDLPLIT